jgi:hypothetical protein
MDASFDGTHGDGISHEIRLKPRLDGEKPADLRECCHKLRKRHLDGAVPPFPD